MRILMRAPTASLMTISTWPAAASEPGLSTAAQRTSQGTSTPQDVVAQRLDLRVVPLAVRFAVVGDGVHFRAELRIRLGPVQQLDQSVDRQLPPRLQPQEIFLRVDRILRLHNARPYPRIAAAGPRRTVS